MELPEEVIALISKSKIQAIRKLRELTGLGLRETKEAIEDYIDGNSNYINLKVKVKEYQYLYVRDLLLSVFGVVEVVREEKQ